MMDTWLRQLLCFSPVGDIYALVVMTVACLNMRTAPFHGDDVNISSDNHMFHKIFISFSTPL